MATPGNLGSQVPPGEDAAVRKMADLQRELRELGPSVAASFASTVAALRAQQSLLATQQDLLTTQQGLLATQQAALAANSASIADVEALQTRVAVAHDSTSGFGLPTSPTEILRSTIAVPAGFTRALVMTTTTLTLYTPAVGGTYSFKVAGDIQGTTAPYSTGNTLDPGQVAVTSPYARILTGISGTIFTRCVAFALVGTAGSGLSSANLATTVTFMR